MKVRSKLLVSVRSAVEAQAALSAGADIIDVKEPSRGSLGCPDTATLNDISKVVTTHVPLSIALGEWRQAHSLVLPEHITWVKVGFSHCNGASDRHRGWLTWITRQHQLLPARLIGVVYADHLRVRSPGFDHVLKWVLSTKSLGHNPPGILIDTAIKDGMGLLNWQSISALQRFKAKCHRHGLFLALAGSLSFDDVVFLQKQVKPDVLAVRGAACVRSSRTSSIHPDRVRSLAQCLQANS